MSIPGFDAESSLGPTLGIYRGSALFGGPGAGAIMPSRGFSASSMLSLSPGNGLLGPLWPKIKCCKFSLFAGAVVCAERAHSPLEDCRCKFPECPEGFPDCSRFPDLPSIECRPPVASF